MKKTKGFVEMTLEQYENLLVKGGKYVSSWTVSNYDNCVYFWDVEKIMENEEVEKEEAIEISKKSAMESGLVNVANFESDYLIRLELSIPKNLIDDDDSCENMNEASCIHINDFVDSFIVGAEKAKVSVMLYPYILCGIIGNKYFEQQFDNPLLSSLIEAVKDTDAVYDIIENEYYIDFEYMDISTLKKAI